VATTITLVSTVCIFARGNILYMFFTPQIYLRAPSYYRVQGMENFYFEGFSNFEQNYIEILPKIRGLFCSDVHTKTILHDISYAQYAKSA